MAPMTRRSQANSGVTKKVHRKQQPQAAKRQTSDSWEMLDSRSPTRDLQENGQVAVEEEMGEEDQEEPLDIPSTTGTLRDMADRVGNEVEIFAQRLDEALDELRRKPGHSESERFDWANNLMHEYQLHIEDTVGQLEKVHGDDRKKQARNEWSERARLSDTSNALERASSFNTSVLGPKRAQQAKEIRDMQQEAALWELLQIMLELQPFEKEAEQDRKDKKKKLEKMGVAHRYTSEDELWERFELSNDVAIERRKIKAWLERTANASNSKMGDMLAELEKKAGRGGGLWTSGWLHTREKIKGETRLRNWKGDNDMNLPEIRRTGDNDLLAVRLDPDAPIRQQRVLEKQDAYFERAMWITCWEMLRRGTPWYEVAQWCDEHKEGWRAQCLGVGADTSEPGSSRAAWRHLCRVTAQSGCTSEYEAAVFGLLGGNEEEVKKVCHSVDDRLYAFYNAKLLRAFDSFVLRNFPETNTIAQLGQVDTNALETPEQANQATVDLLARLRKESATKDEMQQPLKMMQNYILVNEVGSLLNTIGIMIGETARTQDGEGLIFFRSRKPVDVAQHIGERDIALNQQTLRIAAHLSIMWRILKNEPPEGDDIMEDDNIVVAYIQALRKAGKRDLIPTYASRLQPGRCVLVMGRVLQDIIEGEEQIRMLRQLQLLKLNVVEIMIENLNLSLDASFPGTTTSGIGLAKLRILEATTDTKLHPGQKIRAGFLSEDITETDEALVRSLQWFMLHHGRWAETFAALTEALMRSLLHNNLPLARYIVSTLPYSTISKSKTSQILSPPVSLNLMDAETAFPPTLSRQEFLTRDLLRRQSRTYYELSLLVRALEAMAHWSGEETRYVEKAARPSAIPSSLKQAKTGVSEAMEPILKGILLEPRDELEAAKLERVRAMYLPEMVVAFNTVLHAAGNLITRDALLESMDVAVAVAADEEGKSGGGNGLAACVRKAGRMRELVASFALTSKAMLVLKAEGKPWKARREREGKELGIWEIAGRGGEGEE